MVVADGQHQRDETPQHQSQDLHLAQSLVPASSGRSVAVTSAADLREDVHSGHVEEGAGRKEHGDASCVDVRQRLLAALRGRREEGGFQMRATLDSGREAQKEQRSCCSGRSFSSFTWLRPKKVSMARSGAASAKTRRCLRMRFLSRPACIRNDTRPKAAGACGRQKKRLNDLGRSFLLHR